jgi:hypothetical protein
LDFDPMVILRATSILGRQKEDKKMMCSITLNVPLNFLFERQVEALNIT